MFHADNAQRVYIQSRYLFLTGDGTIVSATSMGAGTVYTVVSDDNTATAAQLRDATTAAVPLPIRPAHTLKPDQQDRYLQLPHPYPQGGRPGPADHRRHRIPGRRQPPHLRQGGGHRGMDVRRTSRYTTDIPPLAPGADAVDSFLFGTRRGFCEQISTATVVMLRSLGIPARETVGYVPGSYNPITDLYDVQAKDAHAWVQVWFPGYGWQNFDPTADVPLANPSPGLGAGPQRRPRPRRACPGSPSASWSWSSVAGRRVPSAAPPAAPAHLGPPGRRRPRARRGAAWAGSRRTDETLSAYGGAAGRGRSRRTATG